MKTSPNFSKLIKSEHEQKWVAISKDHKEIVSYDASLVKLKRTVGIKDVVYMKVPSANVFLSF